MAKRSRKKWLYVAYKEQHPEIYGRQKNMDFTSVKRVWWKASPVVVFIVLNILAIGMMMLLNADIRSWIIWIF